jgi:hypothetical protein
MLDRGLHLTREAWAQRIGAAWESAAADAIAAWFAIGADLIAAKASLPRGEFLRMVASELPFGKRTAQRLMKVAADPRLTNATHVSLLPPSWGTLHELTRLDDAEFNALLADGVTRPDVERHTINKTRILAKVAADERRVLGLVPVEGKCRTLLLDPAWDPAWLSRTGRAMGGYAKQSPRGAVRARREALGRYGGRLSPVPLWDQQFRRRRTRADRALGLRVSAHHHLDQAAAVWVRLLFSPLDRVGAVRHPRRLL